MKVLCLALLGGVVLLLCGCLGAPRAEDIPAAQPATGASSGPASGDATAAVVQWQYPIAPGVWYPGDGPLPEHPFKYYRLRCWPGCHDPNSAPRPHP